MSDPTGRLPALRMKAEPSALREFFTWGGAGIVLLGGCGAMILALLAAFAWALSKAWHMGAMP